MINPRQKCTMWGQISLPRISWKGTTLPINVKAVWGGGGGGRAWCGDLAFFKNLSWNSLPTSKSFQSNAQKFPSADKFYQGCYGQGKMKIFQGQGKVREPCFLAQCIKVGNGPLKTKLNLSEHFQPGRVFRFENRASVYFYTAIY